MGVEAEANNLTQAVACYFHAARPSTPFYT